MTRSLKAILSDAPGYALIVHFMSILSVFVPLALVFNFAPAILWAKIPRTMFLGGWALGMLSYIALVRFITRYADEQFITADVYLDTIEYPMEGENDELE